MFTNNVEKVPEFEFKTVETVIHKSQIYTRPLPPQGWENGEPWLSRGFILDIGGVGVCCPILFCPRMKKVFHSERKERKSFIRRSWSQTVSWFPLVFAKIYFWQNFIFSGFFLQLLLIVKGLEGFCLPEREKNIHTLVLTNSSTCVLRLWCAGTKTRL